MKQFFINGLKVTKKGIKKTSDFIKEKPLETGTFITSVYVAKQLNNQNKLTKDSHKLEQQKQKDDNYWRGKNYTLEEKKFLETNKTVQFISQHTQTDDVKSLGEVNDIHNPTEQTEG